MGHVPAGQVSQEREGAHVPRRQRGRGGASRSRAAHRRRVGVAGERVAAAFLARRGCSILARNVRAGRGEIDLLIRDRGVLVAVEVKTGADPSLNFTRPKVDSLRAAMKRLSPTPQRLDLVTVTPRAESVTVRWQRGAG